MKLVLASQSPYRKALLENFGLKFETQPPRVDEDRLKKTGPTDLVELTKYLALKKAERLQSLYDNAVIIGSDQICELGNHRLDKPGSQENAIIQLTQMSGKTHRLITSVAVVSPLKTSVATNITAMKMRELKFEEIAAYVKTDNPIDCAGSYKIEKAGLSLMESVDTEDPSAIQGLPMIALTKALSDLGIHLTQLWSPK